MPSNEYILDKFNTIQRKNFTHLMYIRGFDNGP